MKERPILFSGPMVRAILEGRKSQTRRVVKHRNDSCGDPIMPNDPRMPCPFGGPGDRLWVRETWCCENPAYVAQYKEEPWRGSPDPDNARILYAADPVHQNAGCSWRPSIFLPRWASRITLEVTGVRVERLQDISEADAMAEGVTQGVYRGPTGSIVATCEDQVVEGYRDLWESINGPGFWDANPWVWVVEFKRVEVKP
jgi:hypothetical protein